MIIDGGLPTVFISDMDRSIAFYTGVLELKLRERSGNYWALIETREGLIFGLHPASSHGPPSGTVGSITIGFNVTRPLDEVVDKLRARGVRFHASIKEGAEAGLRTVFFGDPDGNQFYLCEATEER
ncbi:MAG TPA: VOC family protein [Candidatus Krumholzibacteria bacterium]|nr:VOC family protein [Candidatus Krumholzibacteria bacterium]